ATGPVTTARHVFRGVVLHHGDASVVGTRRCCGAPHPGGCITALVASAGGLGAAPDCTARDYPLGVVGDPRGDGDLDFWVVSRPQRVMAWGRLTSHRPRVHTHMWREGEASMTHQRPHSRRHTDGVRVTPRGLVPCADAPWLTQRSWVRPGASV